MYVYIYIYIYICLYVQNLTLQSESLSSQNHGLSQPQNASNGSKPQVLAGLRWRLATTGDAGVRNQEVGSSRSRRHQMCHFHNSAISRPAYFFYGFDFARHCEYFTSFCRRRKRKSRVWCRLIRLRTRRTPAARQPGKDQTARQAGADGAAASQRRSGKSGERHAERSPDHPEGEKTRQPCGVQKVRCGCLDRGQWFSGFPMKSGQTSFHRRLTCLHICRPNPRTGRTTGGSRRGGGEVRAGTPAGRSAQEAQEITDPPAFQGL